MNLSLKHPFSRLMLVHVLYLAGIILAGSLFEVYFFNLGLSIAEIFFTGIFLFIGAPLVAPLFRGFSSKRFMLIGIGISLVAILVLYLFPNIPAAYLFRFLIGLTFFVYWVPFNTVYYEYRKGNHAFLGAIYFSIMPLLALVLPGFSGWIAESFGYPMLYLIAILSLIVTFVVAFFILENRNYKYDFMRSLKSIAGLRTLFFLEGFTALSIVALTLKTMLLLFADKPLEFGGFLSLVTIFSILASLLTGKISDKQQNRRVFLLISAAGIALAALFASQTQDIAMFFLGFGIIAFFRTIFLPLPLALGVDNSKSLVNTMVGREFALGLGRVLAAAVGYLMILYSDIQAMLMVQGIAILLYIPLFELKKKKLKRI